RNLKGSLICNNPVQYPPRRPWNKGRWAKLRQIYYIGLMKILSACILVAQELHSIDGQLVLISKIYHQRDFMYHKQWQHLTLYLTFFLTGCADMVSQNLLPQRCVALEQGAQAVGILLFLPLMVSHMQDTEGVELQFHILFTQAVFLLTVVVTAELWAPNVMLVWMTKAFLYMVTGSWLAQIGFSLFKPISGYKWMDNDKNDLAFTATFFCWHLIFNASLMIWIYGFSFVSFLHRCPALKQQTQLEQMCPLSSLASLSLICSTVCAGKLNEIRESGNQDLLSQLPKHFPQLQPQRLRALHYHSPLSCENM
uniref:Transmembrane epididymal protein 1 n=1 Tax=Sciurus vulgaris TaxID=55149 RepID=A0A8D2CY29_SCIVU